MENKSDKAITQAYLFFNTEFVSPLDQAQLEIHIQALKEAQRHLLIMEKLLPLLGERYYELINKKIPVEEYLLDEFIGVLPNYFSKASNQELLVVGMWTSISQLKANLSKATMKLVLTLVAAIIQRLEDLHFKMESIFPQLYSTLMKYVINPIDHKSYDQCLQILGILICDVLAFKQELVFPKQQSKFDTECLNRLEGHLQLIG